MWTAFAPPQKQLVVIPNAGHDVMYTKNDEFLALLDQWVRPLAVNEVDESATPSSASGAPAK